MKTSIINHAASFALINLLTFSLLGIPGCAENNYAPTITRIVPHEAEWGIYELDLITMDVKLVYSTESEIYTSTLGLNSAGNKLVFAQKVDGINDDNLEILSIDIDGRNLRRLTDNKFWDLYPVWSPEGDRVAFLSKRDRDLDIYLMNADGSGTQKLYDSGLHDADIDWIGSTIVFTSQFGIWQMNNDGTQPARVTNPPGQGEWGQANLPKGDYDPRLSHDGKRIVFERLRDASQINGGYDLFIINIDGSDEVQLTNTGYAQGLANWSHSEEKIVYLVAAINREGQYDIYVMNTNGTENHNVTPSYFPASFLCHSPCFSIDDSKILFIGQWWK